jgi:TonB-linked SusC/RagA family outer membrane protein
MKHSWGLITVLLLGTLSGSAAAQGRLISGTVSDSVTSEPLSGAIVTIAGTRVFAYAKDNGRFAMPDVPEGEVTLQVRLVGYKQRSIVVAADENTIAVSLLRDILKLEEIVVTGQVTSVARRNLANAVATVSSEDIGVVPTASIEQQLQGKVAGADIQTNSGAPGGGVQLRLRGITSINATAEPLYVVDGVIMSDVAIPSNQNFVTKAASGSNPSLNQDAQVNRIADLNPSDIENIEILKGASASAIYGGRASNGVVIISTKRGRPGPAQFTMTQRLGFFELSNKLGERQFDSLSAFLAFGAASSPYFATLKTPFFDNEAQLSNQKGLSSETQASVSGGDDNTRYYASGTLKHDDGIIANTGFKRQGVRLNLEQQVGKRINVRLNNNLLHTLAQRGLTNNDNTNTSFGLTLAFTPSFIDLRQKPDGTYPFVPTAFTTSNALQTAALMKNNEDVYRFTTSGRVAIDAWQGERSSLRFISDAGVDFFTQQNSLLFPPELQFEAQNPFPGTTLLSNSNNLDLNIGENAVHTYTPDSKSFSLTSSAGIQYTRRKLDISRLTGKNLIGGQSNIDAATVKDARETHSLIKAMGYFGQFEFLTDSEKLLVTAGLRADQSSLNADSRKLFWYPKVAASYRFLSLASFIPELKLRAAFGESGNEPTYGQLFTPLAATNNIEGLPTLVTAGTTGAPDLRPEREKELEGGFDANLWNNYATLQFTLFQKNISDLLVPRNLAQSTGLQQEFLNGGKMRTRGIEIALGILPIHRNDLSWQFRTTFSANRSKITQLDVPEFNGDGFGTSIGTFKYKVGQSPTAIIGNDTTGGTVHEAIVGDANPDFRMSFTNDVSFHAFTLHFLLDWQHGSSILNLTKLLSDFGQVTEDYADPIAGSNPAQTVGERRLAGFRKVSKNYVESASFLKLREITISWDLPASAVHSLLRGGRYIRLSLSGRNLFTSTPYTGLDPEVSNFGNRPVGRNIDVAPFPPSRSFFFGVDLGF